MSFFQRKNSKKVKDSEGSQKKGKDSRGKNDLFDRARGGLDALAGSFQSAKNDAETATEKLQGDAKSGIETILQRGSGLLEKAKEEFGGHSEASRSKELEQASEEQGSNMEAFNKVMDKVKSHPEVVEKVKDEVLSLADALHLRKHDKEPEAEEKAKEGETAQSADESASGDKTEDPNVLEQAVEEIQAVAAALQQHQTAPAAETETEAEVPVETAAAAETSGEGEKPEETNREVEKDDPKKRLDFLGFFAMLFERFCNPGNKKKD